MIPEIKDDCFTNGLDKNVKVLEDKISETKNLANITISSNANEEN